MSLEGSGEAFDTVPGSVLDVQDTAGTQTMLISNSNNKDTAILVSFKGDGSVDIKTNGLISLTDG